MALDLARRLSAEGLLSDAELLAVVARRAVLGEPVPVALRALNIAGAQAIEALFDRMGYAPVHQLTPSPVASRLPAGLLRAMWAVPVGTNDGGCVVAMADPTDAHALAELAYHLAMPVDPRTASLEALREVLDELDPLEAPRMTRTRPWRVAPTAPEPDYTANAHVQAPSDAALRDHVMDLARRPSARRNTPAYGSVLAETSAIPALGRARGAEGSRPSARPRVLNIPRRTIGGVPGPAAASHKPPDSAIDDRQVPVPLARSRPRRQVSVQPPLPADMLSILGELQQAGDRDTVARLVARGMLSAARRAAFFVVKRGVVQGWEGATTESHGSAGFARDALRNLWIPVTSQGVFRRASEAGRLLVGSLSESTADSILAAALGGHPDPVLLQPIIVRGHCLAFLYADNLIDPKGARGRAAELTAAALESLERLVARVNRGR